MVIILKSIGWVHSPFKSKQDIEPEKFATRAGFDQIGGELEFEDEFADGIAEYCTYRLEPTTPAETQVVMALVPADGESPPVEYPW